MSQSFERTIALAADAPVPPLGTHSGPSTKIQNPKSKIQNGPEPVIYELGAPGRRGYSLPSLDVPVNAGAAALCCPGCRCALSCCCRR